MLNPSGTRFSVSNKENVQDLGNTNLTVTSPLTRKSLGPSAFSQNANKQPASHHRRTNSVVKPSPAKPTIVTNVTTGVHPPPFRSEPISSIIQPSDQTDERDSQLVIQTLKVQKNQLTKQVETLQMEANEQKKLVKELTAKITTLDSTIVRLEEQAKTLQTQHNELLLLHDKSIDAQNYIQLQTAHDKLSAEHKQLVRQQKVITFTESNARVNWSLAANCARCQIKFSKLFKPRHHCRSCGDSVCNKCSTDKVMTIAAEGSQPVRACHECLEDSKAEKVRRMSNLRSRASSAVQPAAPIEAAPIVVAAPIPPPPAPVAPIEAIVPVAPVAAIPIAPPMSAIPLAPPMTSVPIAPPMTSTIPIAPPMTITPQLPAAPEMTRIKIASDAPIAPPMIAVPIAPPMTIPTGPPMAPPMTVPTAPPMAPPMTITSFITPTVAVAPIATPRPSVCAFDPSALAQVTLRPVTERVVSTKVAAPAPAPMESMLAELKARKNRQAKKISPKKTGDAALLSPATMSPPRVSYKRKSIAPDMFTSLKNQIAQRRAQIEHGSDRKAEPMKVGRKSIGGSATIAKRMHAPRLMAPSTADREDSHSTYPSRKSFVTMRARRHLRFDSSASVPVPTTVSEVAAEQPTIAVGTPTSSATMIEPPSTSFCKVAPAFASIPEPEPAAAGAVVMQVTITPPTATLVSFTSPRKEEVEEDEWAD